MGEDDNWLSSRYFGYINSNEYNKIFKDYWEEYELIAVPQNSFEKLVLEWFSEKINDGCTLTLKRQQENEWNRYNAFTNLYDIVFTDNNDKGIFLFDSNKMVGKIEATYDDSGCLMNIKFDSFNDRAQSFIVLGQDLQEFFRLMDITLINLTD